MTDTHKFYGAWCKCGTRVAAVSVAFPEIVADAVADYIRQGLEVKLEETARGTMEIHRCICGADSQPELPFGIL